MPTPAGPGVAPPRTRSGAEVVDGPCAGPALRSVPAGLAAPPPPPPDLDRAIPIPTPKPVPPAAAVAAEPTPSRLVVGLMRAERGSSGLLDVLPGVRAPARARAGVAGPEAGDEEEGEEEEGTRGRALAREEAVGVVRPRPVVGRGTVGCACACACAWEWSLGLRGWVGEREGRERVRERGEEVDVETEGLEAEGDAAGAAAGTGAARGLAARSGRGTSAGDSGRAGGGGEGGGELSSVVGGTRSALSSAEGDVGLDRPSLND